MSRFRGGISNNDASIHILDDGIILFWLGFIRLCKPKLEDRIGQYSIRHCASFGFLEGRLRWGERREITTR